MRLFGGRGHVVGRGLRSVEKTGGRSRAFEGGAELLGAWRLGDWRAAGAGEGGGGAELGAVRPGGGALAGGGPQAPRFPGPRRGSGLGVSSSSSFRRGPRSEAQEAGRNRGGWYRADLEVAVVSETFWPLSQAPGIFLRPHPSLGAPSRDPWVMF